MELRRRRSLGLLETREAWWNYEEDDLWACWKRGKQGGTTKKTIFWLVGNEGSLVELRRRRSFGLFVVNEGSFACHEGYFALRT